MALYMQQSKRKDPEYALLRKELKNFVTEIWTIFLADAQSVKKDF